MVYTDTTPTKPGYYWVHNGYIEMVAHVYPAGDGVTLMVDTLPAIGPAQPIKDLRPGLRWCGIDSPTEGFERARILADDGTAVDVIRPIGSPYPLRLEKA